MSQWFYSSGGTQAGPVDDATLRQLAASGRLSPTDLVWKDGMPEWTPAAQAAGLFEAAAPARPTTLKPSAAGPSTLSYEVGGAGTPVTPRTAELLRQTRPWVRLFSVIIFFGFGCLAIGALFALFAGLAGGGRGGIASGVGSMINLAVGLLYFFPALFLWRYANAITRLSVSSRANDLEAAIEAQKSFWKFVGIATLVGICLAIVVIVAVVVIGIGVVAGR